MMNKKGSVCPLLLDPDKYVPDTIDLINDRKERDYWLSCLEAMVKKFVRKAGLLNPDHPNAEEKALECFNKFHQLIEEVKIDPKLQPLSVRTLLEFNEMMLRESSFKDAWFLQKAKETQAAFDELKERLEYLDTRENFKERWLELAKGVLAGNMFDWGAKAVTDILEFSNDFSLLQAMETMQKRPWFRDDLDLWTERLKKRPYKTAVIFVDNAGVDFVLGILPMMRELLKYKTKVILSGNSEPALNDITHQEMRSCLKKASEICPIIEESLIMKQILVIENGQSGPCLDLSNLNTELCNLMKNADLIILEGMGRAVHTNYKAQFKVDSLKMAVLKNEWLANSLGADQFSIIFEYNPIE